MKKLYLTVEQQTRNKIKPRMEVEVELHDNRVAFGHRLCLIKPVTGKGEIWVREESLIIKK